MAANKLKRDIRLQIDIKNYKIFTLKAFFIIINRDMRKIVNKNVNIKSGALLYEIKSFYQTFILLKEKNDKRMQMMASERFNIKEYEELDLYFPSYVINSCFLAELELKFLLSITGVEFSSGSKGHLLNYLFNIISTTNKVEMKTHYNNLISLYYSKSNYPEYLIKQFIDQSSYNYRDFRYMWERGSLHYNSTFMDMFVTANYEYIVKTFNHLFPL